MKVFCDSPKGAPDCEEYVEVPFTKYIKRFLQDLFNTTKQELFLCAVCKERMTSGTISDGDPTTNPDFEDSEVVYFPIKEEQEVSSVYCDKCKGKLNYYSNSKYICEKCGQIVYCKGESREPQRSLII